MTPLVGICLLLTIPMSKVCTAQATTATAGDCSCPLINKPVCTSIAITVANKCLATCQGLQVKANGTCAGDDIALFAALSETFANEAGATAAFAVGQGVASNKDINRYRKQGFYFSRAQQGRAGGPNDTIPSVNTMPSGLAFKAAGTLFTPSGYIYVQPPAYVPPPTSIRFTSAKAPAARVARGQVTTSNGTRRLLQSYGADDRFQLCSAGLQLPYSAVGRITYNKASGSSRCSGIMVGENDFLTAAHCLWDVKAKTWYKDWSVTPAYYNGQSPFGTATWSHVSIFSAYQTEAACQLSGMCAADIAVVHLNKIGDKWPGQLSGWMGFGYECSQASFVTQNCGYPGITKNGQLPWCNFCDMPNNCKSNGGFGFSLPTSCSIERGQSGSGLWTADHVVRAVLSGEFTRPISIESGTSVWPTITKDVFQQILDWTNSN